MAGADHMSGNISSGSWRFPLQVTDFKDGRPRVSPEGLNDRPAGHGRASGFRSLLALLSLALAVTLLLIAQDRGSSIVADATTTTSVPSPSTTVPASVTLRSVLPETRGTLVAAIGQDPIQLTTWPSTGRETTRPIPVEPGPDIDFDESGSYLAFLGATKGVDAALYVGSPNKWYPLTSHVTSFSWHATDAGRIAWTGLGLLCNGKVVPEGGLGGLRCLLDVEGAVVGFDDAGYLMRSDSGKIVRLDASGAELSRFDGEDALVGPDGKVLIVGPGDVSGIAAHEFFITDANMHSFAKLDWAPTTADAEYGFVTWSPDPAPPRLAFLVARGGGHWQLQIRTLDGGLVAEIDLDGRFWDVDWDSTGRYILSPGITDSGLELLVYDTFSGDAVYVPFTDWVQNAHLVTESACADATHLASSLILAVDGTVGLGRPRMVRSRDATLEDWFFVSAVVETGSHAGETATWFLTGYDGSRASDLHPMPANDTARSLSAGPSRLEPLEYGVVDWMLLDGARRSQLCVAG